MAPELKTAIDAARSAAHEARRIRPENLTASASANLLIAIVKLCETVESLAMGMDQVNQQIAELQGIVDRIKARADER